MKKKKIPLSWLWKTPWRERDAQTGPPRADSDPSSKSILVELLSNVSSNIAQSCMDILFLFSLVFYCFVQL